MVKRLKRRLPFAPVVRMATCMAMLSASGQRCGWMLAACSLDELESVGWHVTINGFACRTCGSELKRAGVTIAREAFFRLPHARPDAYPRVGGKGEVHEVTSRPAEIVPVAEEDEDGLDRYSTLSGPGKIS